MGRNVANAKPQGVCQVVGCDGLVESQCIDTSGLVVGDTNSPPPVSNLSARGFRDRIELLSF